MDGSRHPEFAAKLLRARKRTGKSQERLAAEIGTSRRHYIRWENGDHIPSAEFLVRIGEAVGQPEEFQPDDDAEAASMSAATADFTNRLDALLMERAFAILDNAARIRSERVA